MTYLVNDTSTTSKRSLWPDETRNLWVVDAMDSQLRLSNMQWYTDWCSALGANTLGYGTLETGFSPAASLPWNTENCFAKNFCQAMGTGAVRFFKTGSDAVSCAVRLARAYTRRGHVVVFDKSYHGSGDWFGHNLWRPANGWTGGIVDWEHLIIRPFGELLEEPLALDVIAAVVVEPVPKATLLPPPGWLQHLREVCDEYGIVLISDEIILGYRVALRGFLESWGIGADLRCYGKAMGQGAAIAACTGRSDLMDLLHTQVHFSGTNNGELGPLVIADKTLAEYLSNNVCDKLADKGLKLQDLLQHNGFEVKGLMSRFEVVFDSPERRMDATRYLWHKKNIMFPGFCSMALSHTEAQMSALVEGLKEWREKK